MLRRTTVASSLIAASVLSGAAVASSPSASAAAPDCNKWTEGRVAKAYCTGGPDDKAWTFQISAKCDGNLGTWWVNSGRQTGGKTAQVKCDGANIVATSVTTSGW